MSILFTVVKLDKSALATDLDVSTPVAVFNSDFVA